MCGRVKLTALKRRTLPKLTARHKHKRRFGGDNDVYWTVRADMTWVNRADDAAAGLSGQLLAYRARWPDEAAVADAFLDLLDDADDPFVRERSAGHFTGSSWLVSRDGRRTLLTHHRKLGRWLQLGGHADGERDLARVALKEAEEESGLRGLTLVTSAIFDLDRHWIPERGSLPGHWHYDARYVVRAGVDEAFTVSEESLALAWRPVAALVQEPDLDPSLRRMAAKWQRENP